MYKTSTLKETKMNLKNPSDLGNNNLSRGSSNFTLLKVIIIYGKEVKKKTDELMKKGNGRTQNDILNLINLII